MQTMILQFTESANYPDEGRMNGVAYDTAWVGRVKDSYGSPLFPQCINWLVENQKADGSWGSCVNHIQDRILSTLVSILALSETDKPRYASQIRRGESYIWDHVDQLGTEYRRLAGIELIFPTLMREAEEGGLNLPFHTQKYETEKKSKLDKIDPSLWYKKCTTLPYSLEFLGEAVDMNRISALFSANGSVFNSPSTTAYVFSHTRNQHAFAYLKRTLSKTGNGSIMTVHPFEIFESGWMIYNFMLGGIIVPDVYGKFSQFFMQCMTPRGWGASVYFPLPDADDTAIIAQVLAQNGVTIDPSLFEQYLIGNHLVTYGFEETESSITTNIHVFDFLKKCRNSKQAEEMTEHIFRFIQQEMRQPGYWEDKWHISPYYPTSHAIIALSSVDDYLTSRGISWLLETQHENGMWGYEDGSIEETAYALQALLYYHLYVEQIDLDAVIKGISHLFTMNMGKYPELWVAKGLYVPTNIVRSAVISALNLYRTAMKRNTFKSQPPLSPNWKEKEIQIQTMG